VVVVEVVVVCTVAVITRLAKQSMAVVGQEQQENSLRPSPRDKNTTLKSLISHRERTLTTRNKAGIFIFFSFWLFSHTHGSIRGSGVDRGLSFNSFDVGLWDGHTSIQADAEIHGRRADLRSSNGGHGARTHTY